MTFNLTSLAGLRDAPFDQVIDVRSPAEFAEDHIPGAINLPVLSDAERARVGTIYVQDSRFRARKIGAALVARNAARHIETALADKDGSWRPLLYCWRGGQRSGSFASILSQIGWRVDLLDGGYKHYRAHVVKGLHDMPLPHRLILLEGGTGTGKTRILSHIARRGGQVIDLEALAQHRGSLFGQTTRPQPSQKMLESRLMQALLAADPNRPLFMEAESNRIGQVNMPASLWKAMQAAPRIAIKAPLAARAHFLVANYGALTDDLERLDALLVKLIPFHGHSVVAGWRELAQEGHFTRLAQDLVDRHYDPRYRKAARMRQTRELVLEDLSDDSLRNAAADILDNTTLQMA